MDRVFARIGASDNLVQYQSTFMSEMLETAFILAQATEQSLVVVDEVGKNSYQWSAGLDITVDHCLNLLNLGEKMSLLLN